MNPTFETGDEAELKFDYHGSSEITVWGWSANATKSGIDGLVTLVWGTHKSNVEGVDVGNGTKALGGNWLILGNSSRVVPVWQVREARRACWEAWMVRSERRMLCRLIEGKVGVGQKCPLACWLA